MPAVEMAAYGGWANCARLSNGMVDLVVTLDVGPRMIRFGFCGGPNVFYEDAAALGKTGGDEWRLYGGHRLWHAPERDGRTNTSDNRPVACEALDGFVRVTQPAEPQTGIQKELEVRLLPGEARAHVIHRLRNAGVWAVELAPWALSVMAGGGTAIIPLPPRGTHPENLLPTGGLALWPYADMSDPRWVWGRQFILLRQRGGPPQKIGSAGAPGWLAYANTGLLFVKTFCVLPGAVYPDMGSAAEVFTNADLLELESLGPLARLEPGAAVEHVEEWALFDGVAAPQNDADVLAAVMPKVMTVLA